MRIYRKNATPHAHGHLAKAILCENSHDKMPRPGTRKRRGEDIVRACAVETYMDTSQEQFYARIYSKKAGGQRAYPDLTPALTAIVRTPQCGHTVWGTMINDGWCIPVRKWAQ
jgi:hypothetical protein